MSQLDLREPVVHRWNTTDPIPDRLGSWFAGFTDGEGCFYGGSVKGNV